MKRNIRRRMIVALIGILLIAGVPVWAQTVVSPIGQPNIVLRPQPAYYIWADQTGWHVRWTTPYPGIFSGTVTSDGEVRDIRRAGGGTPGWLSRFGAQRVIFGTWTAGGTEGFDFTTTGATVSFSLLVNAFHVPRTQVFIGRSGQNPAGIPVVLSATPAMLVQADEPRELRVDREEFRNRTRDEFGQ